MDNSVAELRIVGPEGNIFDTDIGYTIPLYQRAFAWEDKQITQLIEDLSDISEDANYYIGSLIVSRQKNKFEVVDGQQRLTSLYLLLNCLDFDVKNTLTFACRDKSNYTLENIKEIRQKDWSKLDVERIEPSIQRGLKVMTELLKKKDDLERGTLCKNLERVILYRIEVPEHTDLNRYFEIMNTRGEQLEQHDILKAALMGNLHDNIDKAVFARVWDACSDMTGYVQMHFISKYNIVRDRLFGGGWDEFPSAEWEKYRSAFHDVSLYGTGQKISKIIDPNYECVTDDGYVDDDVRVRFESVIEFPFFLIHVLKVLIEIEGIRHEDGYSPIIAEMLDDKKLVDTFKYVIEKGVTNKGRISEDDTSKEQFSKAFIICLLRTRFLFDKYIIKREYANENSDGEWSLKSLFVSGSKNQKKAYYRNSDFTKFREWKKFNGGYVKSNIMIQSALRVSYTSPRVMHWITQLLIWMSSDNYLHTKRSPNDVAELCAVAENIAKKAVKQNFFDLCPDGVYAMGVNTPHIVFNYLDYLLWNKYKQKKEYDGFVFEFRNSVEHWYPQNPSEGTFEQWKDGVDQFGNLCIIQRNVNSKFSNMAPEAKKSTFRDMIAKGSLKLRLMSELTQPYDNMPASLYWKETAYKIHEAEMIALLKQAVIDPEDNKVATESDVAADV